MTVPEKSEIQMAMYDAQVGKAEKPNYAEIIDEREGGSDPSNKDLYARIVAEAKAKFDVYPSAVANAWVSQEYKKRGGTYKSYDEDEDKVKKEYEGCGCATCKELNVNCDNCPVCMANEMKSDCCSDLNKQAPCWDGYVQRGMKPGANGRPVPNCVPAAKADDLFEDSDDVEYDTDSLSKAESYSPPAGARSAARRAIKYKEDGKANGAGTAVGWTRAGQLARGESMSLSTVKRMYSFFSRHEVDKKGKDFNNAANPSNGKIMWLAWGGDAGFAWSRGIANRERDKGLFSDFGKDNSKVVQMDEIFKGIGVGSMVSWNSSGGTAEGKITRIIRDGSYKVPGSNFTISGTKEEPAAVIRLYRNGEATDTIVGHKLKTLRSK